MNVQDVINAALEQARGSSSSSAIAEQRDGGSCADADVTKLAAALNFIGTHLEDDAEKLAYTPTEAALLGSVGLGALGGYMGARSRDKILAKGGVDPYEARIYGMPGRGRAAIGGAEAGAVGSLMTGALLHGDFSPESMLAGGATASALNYLNHRRKAHKTVRRVRSHRAEAELKKLTAEKSAHLQYAAQVGKAALIEKLAEDRINPAKIDAGPADAFSGEVMPASSPVFGGAMSAEQLVAMKAQKVRDRINSDMRGYVSNVGDGYDLSGHLSIFNK